MTRYENVLLRRAAQVYHHLIIDDDVSFDEVVREFSSYDRSQLSRIQLLVPDSSREYITVTFVMAFLGLGFEQNTNRIFHVYEMWHQRFTNKLAISDRHRYGRIIDTYISYVPVMIGVLYRRSNDTRLLEFLLDAEFDGESADSQDEVIGELWNTHRAELLRVSKASSKRSQQLQEAIAYNR